MKWHVLSETDVAEESNNSAGIERSVELPGDQLRNARKEKNLTLEFVSGKLHMDPALVEALESNDYEKFPAPLYVIGFLRNYSRLLEIDPQPLVKAYENLGKEAPPILSELTAKMPRRRPKRVDNKVAFIALGVVVVFALLWWLFEQPAQIETVVQNEIEEEFLSPPDVLANSGDSEAAIEIPQSMEEQQMIEEQQSGVQEITAIQPVHPADELRLKFSADSWVEISDSTSKILFYDMGKEGKEKTVRGRSPFSILLGYAPGVSLEINGKRFDPTPYTRNDVARFKLRGKNDQRP